MVQLQQHIQLKWEQYHNPAHDATTQLGRIRAENKVIATIIWNDGEACINTPMLSVVGFWLSVGQKRLSDLVLVLQEANGE